MGYTVLDCFLCAFCSQENNSLSKKGWGVCLAYFQVHTGLNSAIGIKEAETACSSGIYGNHFFKLLTWNKINSKRNKCVNIGD